MEALEKSGLRPTLPEGSYFILGNTQSIDKQALQEFMFDGSSVDYAACRYLTAKVGVAAIPPSAFYCDKHKHLPADYARFTFCKTDSVLQEASERLKQNLAK